MNLQDLLNKTKLNLNQLKNKDTETDKKELSPARWLPDVGSYFVRFLTSDEDADLKKDMWFRKFDVHFFEKKAFICPKSFGHKCPLCEYGWGLFQQLKEKNSKLEKDKKDRSYAPFLPTQRYVVKLLVRQFEDLKGEKLNFEEVELKNVGAPIVRLFDLSATAIEDINKVIFDPEYGDITNILEGFDFRLTKDKKKEGDKSMQSTISFTVRRNPSPVFSKELLPATKEEKFIETYTKMMDSSPRMQERFDNLSSADIISLLETHLSKMKNADSETVKFDGASAKEKEPEQTQDAFQESRASKFSAAVSKFGFSSD
jgi:hypothetical protein